MEAALLSYSKVCRCTLAGIGGRDGAAVEISAEPIVFNISERVDLGTEEIQTSRGHGLCLDINHGGGSREPRFLLGPTAISKDGDW